MSTTEERFWAKVNKDGPTMAHMETACWVWTGSQNGKGYGLVFRGSEKFRAHRFVFSLTGRPLDPTQDALHKCDNRICVRPTHLYAGSDLDNTRDKLERGRAGNVRGSRHGQAKLAESDIPAIRALCRDGVSLSAIGRRYGVGLHAIRGVRDGVTWRHVGLG